MDIGDFWAFVLFWGLLDVMRPVNVIWKGHSRNVEARLRLLDKLHRLARQSDSYLQPRERPFLTVVGQERPSPRPNVDRIHDVHKGEVLVSTEIGLHAGTLIARAEEAGLSIRSGPDGASYIVLDEVHLRGLDFKLFDPRGLYPENDRMSFVFIDCPQHHFLDGRLVTVGSNGGTAVLSCPNIRLKSYLEDWTDCLFAWIRFFHMGDFWWQRHEELQGYNDYRGVFETVQTERGTAVAEEATFDAVLSTFTQHAEHSRCETQRTA